MRLPKFNKKGIMNNLSGLALALVGFAVVLTVGFLIVAEVQSQIAETQGITDTTNVSQLTVAYNASAETQLAMSDIPGWLGIIVIATIGAALLGLVKMFRV